MSKNIKLLTFIFIVVMTFMCSFYTVKADYKNTITTSDFPSKVKVTLRGDGLVKSDGWQIYNKHTSSNYAICTNFNRENPNKTYECKAQDKWSDAVSDGVASIIREAADSDGKMTPTEYARAEYAINTYLMSAAGGKYKKSAMKDFSKSVSAVKPLVKAAKTTEKNYNNFKKSKLSLKLTGLSCDTNGSCSIKFSLFGKSLKDSALNKITKDSIKVSGYKSGTNPTISFTNSDNTAGKITFTAPDSTGTLSVSVNLTRTYYKAKDYDCGPNQSITLNIIKKKEETIALKATKKVGKTTVSGTTRYVSDELDCPILFEKLSSIDDQPLGSENDYAKINLSGPNSSGPEEIFLNKPLVSVGDDGPTVDLDAPRFTQCKITNLSGTYNYVETAAPKGYINDSQSHSFQFDGTNQTVVEIKNAPNTKLTVKKIDGDTKQPLAGATLELRKDGETLHFRYTNAEQTEAVIDPSSSITNWDSSKTITFVELAYDEQYDVVETAAPKGYIVNNPSTAVTFENQDGAREKTVTIANYKSSVKISKQDITNGKEIPGATLKVIDGQGNVYDEWVSTTTSHEITKLEDGTYYLQETIAPKGYELNTNTVEFTIENGKSKALVVMNDSPTKLSIANTLLGKNVITYIVGGMLVIIGAGVLGYELKKKKAMSK